MAGQLDCPEKGSRSASKQQFKETDGRSGTSMEATGAADGTRGEGGQGKTRRWIKGSEGDIS